MVTGYARLTPWQARATLATLVAATLFCVAVAVSPLWQGKAHAKRRGAGDAALYYAEVLRIHNGEGYYQAAAAELTDRGYPTKSVFNWRTPLPMWLIGKLPQIQWAKYLLGLLSMGVIVFAFHALAREQERSFLVALGCVLLLSGPLLFTVLDHLFVMPVLWAGVLIALSVCAYGINKPILGLGLGLAALFMRDLALPYCLLCICMSWRQGDCPNFCAAKMGLSPLLRAAIIRQSPIRRNWELIGWVLGLVAWLIFFTWHWRQVSGLIAPDALAHPHGWIRFGGAGFVLATAQINAYLLLLPPWITALYFVAAMFGLAGWRTPWGTRVGLTACLYVMAFAFVGQDINQYWGALIGPLLCFGAARSPASLCDLWRAAEIVIQLRSPAAHG
jgi:hypothetical protein